MSKAQIMIVEDEHVVAMDIKMRLTRLGYTVPALAASGEEAVAAATRTRPNLVLMDIRLRGKMDGIEAAERIRTQLDLPVIYLTAYADELTLKRARNTGSYGYLLKPFEETELQTNIEMVLQRHRLEQRLKESQLWLSTVLKSIGDAVIVSDEQGFIKFMNPVAESLTGWSLIEAINRPLTEVFHTLHAESREPRGNPVSPVVDTGKMTTLPEPVLLIARDGTEIFIDDSLAPMRDGQGRITGTVLVFRDVSERWRAAQAQREQHEIYRRLNAAIEQTAEGVIITDPLGTIIYVNPAFEQISGYNRAEVMGQNPHQLMSQEQNISLFQELWAAVQNGQVWQGRLNHKKKDGSVITEEVTISPVRDEQGNIVNYVTIKRDISHEVQLEERYHQAQKMEAVGLLAGGVAHDFNNILTAINGYAELLLVRLPLDSSARDMANTILQSGKRASNLVRQLLAFSRKQMIQPTILDLNGLITDLDKMLKRIIRENIQIEMNLAPDLWDLKADPNQIEQIVLNLAINAQDAMPDGGRLVIDTSNVVLDWEYTAEYVDVEPGEYILLRVTDSGIGMSEDVKARIFEPFFTTKELGRGTGLGLATVYGIVKQNKGHIWIQSEENRGASFHVYLPRAIAPVTGSISSANSEDLPPGVETVLLVEDEAAVRALLAEVLRNQGYTVLEAGNGAEALDLAEEYPQEINLLLTDMVMPGINGLVLASELQKKRPHLKTLIMSGYANQRVVDLEGAQANLPFIHKPFSIKALDNKVREVLDNKVG